MFNLVENTSLLPEPWRVRFVRAKLESLGPVWSLAFVQKKPDPAKAAYQDLRFAVRYLPSNIENDARTVTFLGNAAARSHTESFEREHEESFALKHRTSYMTAPSAGSSQPDQ